MDDHPTPENPALNTAISIPAPAKLSDLKHAESVPGVPDYWSRMCWGAFFCGVIVILVGLAVLGMLMPCLKANDVLPWVLGFSTLAFVLAAMNTYCSATQFGKRHDDIVRWCRECEEHRALRFSKGGDRSDHSEQNKRGSLRMERKSIAGSEDAIRVVVSGVYAPHDYRATVSGLEICLPLTFYLGLLNAETHAARTVCVKLAAALGGVFITGIQVYGRLAQMIADAGSNVP